MKVSRLKYIAMGAILGLSFVSCEDFLDRPNEDSGYYKIPEALSGNLLLGGSPYANFTVNGSDEDMKSTSNS